MILYGAPMTCSMAVHAALRGFGLGFEIAWVERGPGRRVVEPGYGEINPKRKVPSLVLADGETLTEIVSVLAYLDEAYGPGRDAASRRRMLEWLSFVATELHQTVLGPCFDPETPALARTDALERLLPPALAALERHLEARAFVLGDEACVADLYLGWALVLVRFTSKRALVGTALPRFIERMLAQPAFGETLALERASFSAAAS